MGENTKLSRAKMLALRRKQRQARMRESRHADTPCFVYLFVLAETAKLKVGISVDPLVRIRNLPQLHLFFADVFDLRRSFAVYVPRRADAMALEHAALRHFADWRTPAPSGVVSYATGELVCSAPIRWSAGGKKEWLDASVYDDLRHFLVYADRRSPRPAISIAEWETQLEENTPQ